MNIAWIGTGSMGIPMAIRLIRAGHKLKVFNRTKTHAKPLTDMGAELAPTPKDAAKDADMIFCIVTGDDASCAVWEGKDGITAGLKENAIAVECSTLTPARSKALREYIMLNSKALFLTAPVIGTFQDAEAGELMFLVGGSSETFELSKDILSLMSKQILYIGNDQQAMALKLAVTASIATQVILQVELLNFLKSYDLNSEIISLFENLPFTSSITGIMNNLIEKDDFEKLFPVNLVHKDLSYIVASQKVKNQKTIITHSARDAYNRVVIKNKTLELDRID